MDHNLIVSFQQSTFYKNSYLLETESLQTGYFRKDRKEMGDSEMSKMDFFCIENREDVFLQCLAILKKSRRRWKLTVLLDVHYIVHVAAKEILGEL